MVDKVRLLKLHVGMAHALAARWHFAFYEDDQGFEIYLTPRPRPHARRAKHKESQLLIDHRAKDAGKKCRLSVEAMIPVTIRVANPSRKAAAIRRTLKLLAGSKAPYPLLVNLADKSDCWSYG
jgi:hypothetical protein